MSERREAPRRRVYIGGRVVHAWVPSDTACLLRDLAFGGARLLVSATIPLPHRFDLAIDSRGETRPVEIAWRAGDAVGVRFLDAISEPDDTAGLRESLRASRAEAAQLRARLAEIDRDERPVDQRLH